MSTSIKRISTLTKRGLTLALATLAAAGASGAIASAANASVIVDHVWCVEETDEVGSDDVYTVTFRGYTSGAFDDNTWSKGPGNFWDDFDTGDEWSQDIFIAKSRPDAVYVVMLVEYDAAGRDIEGANLDLLRSQLDLTWKAQMLAQLKGGPGPATEAQKAAAGAAIANAMNGWASKLTDFPFGNDEIIEYPKRINVTAGTTRSGSRSAERKGRGPRLPSRGPSHTSRTTRKLRWEPSSDHPNHCGGTPEPLAFKADRSNPVAQRAEANNDKEVDGHDLNSPFRPAPRGRRCAHSSRGAHALARAAGLDLR